MKVADITNEGAYRVLAQAGILPSLAEEEGVRGRDFCTVTEAGKDSP